MIDLYNLFLWFEVNKFEQILEEGPILVCEEPRVNTVNRQTDRQTDMTEFPKWKSIMI